MDQGIKGKRALLTGTGRGLGESMAKNLAAEGARVSVVARTASDIEALVTEMAGAAAIHHGVTMDLMPQDAQTKLIDKVLVDLARPMLL